MTKEKRTFAWDTILTMSSMSDKKTVQGTDIEVVWCPITRMYWEVQTMKYQILQVMLTDAEVDKINDEGHDAVERHAMKLKMDFSKDAGGIASRMYGQGYYDHVANITADNLEGVFDTGNMGPEENIERLDRMSSVSVGDLVIDEDGNKNVVASFGFKEVF